MHSHRISSLWLAIDRADNRCVVTGGVGGDRSGVVVEC
jgi:hypothetical protein